MSRKLFGREPAAFIALIGSIITVLAAMELPVLDAGQAAALAGLASAGVLAWTTRPLTPGLLTGVFTALVALFTEYGLEMSDDLVGGISGAILALFAFITRAQVQPTNTPVTSP